MRLEESEGRLLRQIRKRAIAQQSVALIVAILFGRQLAFAQLNSLRCGFTVGVQVTDPFTVRPEGEHPRSSLDSFMVHPQRFTIGPTCGLTLASRLSIELDAMYKRLYYIEATGDPVVSANYSTQGRSWEIPLLVNGTLLHPNRARFFVGGGVSARHASAENHISGIARFSPPQVLTGTIPSGDLIHPWTAGPVIAVGGAFNFRFVTVQPQLRYIRWLGDDFRSPDVFFTMCPSCAAIQSNRNQLEVLFGLTFGKGGQ